MTVCVVGSINLDIVLSVDGLPLPGQTITALSEAEHSGGKGANQAVAARRMGAPTVFIGAVGQDSAGTELTRRLGAEGVDVRQVVALEEARTGRAYITLDHAGKNAIVVFGGANQALRAAHLPMSVIESAAVLLTQFETPDDVIAELFTMPRREKVVRILNAAPALPARTHLFKHADILIINETELMTYAGLRSVRDAVASLSTAANSLIELSHQVVIVTLGSAGAAIVRPNGVQMIEGRPVAAVDTTGAGDCFCGVLAAQLDAGSEMETAVRVANAAAAISVTRFGAGTSAPSAAEVATFLDQHRG